MIKLEELKKGQWVMSCEGFFEVVKEYETYHNWLTVAEVCFSEEDINKYELGPQSHIADGDASRYTLV